MFSGCSDEAPLRDSNAKTLCIRWPDAYSISIVNQSSCVSPHSTKQFFLFQRETWFQTLRSWFHLSCVTFNPETAPVHRGAHGPMKPNGQHHPQVGRRKQLPQVKDFEYLWDLFTSDDKKNHEQQQFGAPTVESTDQSAVPYYSNKNCESPLWLQTWLIMWPRADHNKSSKECSPLSKQIMIHWWRPIFGVMKLAYDRGS